MNERIKLLAEQAGLRFTQLMSNPMVPVVDGKETDLEKFAELIVLECAQLAEYAGYNQQFGQGGLRAKLHKHFGIEP
jgi:hypothetical protein